MTASVTTVKKTALPPAPRGPSAAAQEAEQQQADADAEAARRRPDGERVEREEVRDRGGEDLRVAPEGDLERDRPADRDADRERPAAPDCDRAGGEQRDRRGNDPVVVGVVFVRDPDLDLRGDRQHDRHDQVDPFRFEPEAPEAEGERAHAENASAQRRRCHQAPG